MRKWIIRTLSSTLMASLLFSAQSAKAEDAQSSFHFQMTSISQQHPGFNSAYSGLNSLSGNDDNQTSLTWTAFAGWRIWKQGEFYIDPELAGGSGFNQTRGIAGFPNGEIYRVDDASPKWSIARFFLQQVLELGDEKEEIKDDKNQLAKSVSIDRLTLVLGKFALNDYFDNNSYSHDPRTQFMNWSLMDNGAWDYAADTRGYSWGLYVELNQSHWALRFSSVLVPVQANQMGMETDFPKYRGDNVEYEYRYKISGLPGTARVLVFQNNANMGNYRSTIETQTGTPTNPIDISKTRSLSIKSGIGFNAEQALSNDLGVFARASLADGHSETWAFTEVDETLSFGMSLKGREWRRENDVFGLALIANELSSDHIAYLNAGGYGFMIGDGKLNYQPEVICETYYLYKIMSGLDFSADYQYVKNPAYNSNRGPVSIFSMRVHYEI